MSELRKANTDHPYFITMTVVGWIDVFTRKELCDIVVKNLKYCQKEKHLKIFEYAIMPSHVHMICQSSESHLADIIRDFKSFTSKEIIKFILENPIESRKKWLLHMFEYYAQFKNQNQKYMFWQKTNHPVELSNPKIFDQKSEYIICNPVSSGLVINPASWYYSSACPNSPLIMDES
jgi:putative transposase